jgi:hypothetical protein
MSLYKNNIFLPSDNLPVGYTRNGNCFTISTVNAGMPTPQSGVGDTSYFNPFFVPTDGSYYVSYNVTIVNSPGAIQESIFTYNPTMVLGSTVINQSYASPALGERQITCDLNRGIYFLSLRSAPGTSYGVSGMATSSLSSQFQFDFGFFINQVKLNGLDFPLFASTRGLRVYDNSTNPAVLHTYNGTISDFDQYRVANKYLYFDGAAASSPKICLARTA